MKKIFIISIILLSLLSAKVIHQKIKENNNTIIQEEAKIIKNWIIKNYNALMPDYLQLSPEDSLLKFSLSYDTQYNKLTSNLNAKLIFPSFEKQITKVKINTGTTKTYKFKITPILQVYKSTLTPVLKNSFTYTHSLLLQSIMFNETFYFYFIHNDYKEITSLAFKKFLNYNNLMFKISKTYYSTQKSNLYYVFGIYYYTQQKKDILTYGLELSGQRKKLPFIYAYKIFTTYRHLIFGDKFTYIDITPYLEASKDWHYQIKPYIKISFNLKF